MINITFIDSNGSSATIQFEEGENLMEKALRENVSGIDADCGGSCSCATCHVYIDESFEGTLEAPSAMERDVLKYAVNSNSSSRLCCQLKATPAMNNLIVRIPESQF